MRRKCLMAITVLTTLLAGGCSLDDYNVVIKNVGQRAVTDAHVSYGSFRSIGGIIVPQTQKGHGHPDYPIPSTATVEWRTEDGVLHRQDVEVKKLASKGFKGDIVFEIADDNTVTVRAVPRTKTP